MCFAIRRVEQRKWTCGRRAFASSGNSKRRLFVRLDEATKQWFATISRKDPTRVHRSHLANFDAVRGGVRSAPSGLRSMIASSGSTMRSLNCRTQQLFDSADFGRHARPYDLIRAGGIRTWPRTPQHACVPSTRSSRRIFAANPPVGNCRSPQRAIAQRRTWLCRVKFAFPANRIISVESALLSQLVSRSNADRERRTPGTVNHVG